MLGNSFASLGSVVSRVVPCWGHVVPTLALVALLSACHKQGTTAKSANSPPVTQRAAASKAPPTPGGIESVPLTQRQPADQALLFQRMLPSETGVEFINKYDVNSHLAWRMLPGPFVAGGVCIGDYDADGRPDLYFTSFQHRNRLYRNLGNMRFEDVTDHAGMGTDRSASGGASFADIDNDGDLDLWVCGYHGTDRLYVNQGNGTFHESIAASGLVSSGANVMMAFEDYDRDGDLDGYLVTNRYWHIPHFNSPLVRGADGHLQVRPEYRQLVTVLKKPDGSPVIQPGGQADQLFQNRGDGTFSLVTADAGIRGNAPGLAATWWDYNDDGLPDIYVSNDFIEPDKLYRNNGDGTFTDVAGSVLPHVPWFSMGADTADINNDGRIDLMASDMSGTTHLKQKLSMGDMGNLLPFAVKGSPPQYMRNALYVNSGSGRFFEAAYLTGMDSSDWTWSIKFGDLDNDGRVDVLVTNGVTRDWINSDSYRKPIDRDDWIHRPRRDEQNLAFRNLGELQFENVSQKWALDETGISMAAAMADLDRDGGLDIVVCNFDRAPSIYRNRSQDGGCVLIQLKGTRSNRFGIGAKVLVRTENGLHSRHLHLASGFMAANEPVLHFGLGAATQINALTIHWPSGHVQQFEDLKTNCIYTVTEPSRAATTPVPATNAVAKIFRPDHSLGQIRHRERPYDDFQRQPLLPNKLSQLGPGLAWGDVDGDGDEDVYLGGAAGFSGQLLLNQSDGRFSPAPGSAWQHHKSAEDMGTVFLDADSDGDLDLYVASGGVESAAGDRLLADRLYLNEGNGQFTVAPAGTLPENQQSASVVAAADFDRDGDVDLFVGSRVIPGRYPRAPMSQLLVNDRGRFGDATDMVAPELRRTGLVTGAVWSDADGDGWVDLLVTHEWGPIKLLLNRSGKLVDATAEAGLADRLGWWNGIAAGDIDNDGDIDYVATNQGLNSKYHATSDRPALLYYGKFGGLDDPRLIEAHFEGQTLFPVRGKSCSTRAIPSLSKIFPSYEAFANADLPMIYTPTGLNEAHTFEANTLESSVLVNDGKGRFTMHPLPRLAQISAGYGLSIVEVNGDGYADLYVVQNFFGPQPETGHMDGGMSLLLLGNGDTTFRPVSPARSGLVIPGDAKSLTTCDLDDNGWVDFVVGVNDDNLAAFLHQGNEENRPFVVRLVGQVGNPTAIGARVTVRTSDGNQQTAEVYAGQGYLSQSSPSLMFGLGKQNRIDEIRVRWPDGEERNYRTERDQRMITLRMKTEDH